MTHPIIVISGLSGSGKSVALHALEDLSYYCVDNLPGGLLADLIDTIRNQPERYPLVAIGIDARTGPDGIEELLRLFEQSEDEPAFRVLFLDADQRVLVRRFSETRRRHPLAGAGGLEEAIANLFLSMLHNVGVPEASFGDSTCCTWRNSGVDILPLQMPK